MKKSYFELKQKTQKLCIHTSLCGIVLCAWIEALKQWQNNVGLNTEKYSLVQWNPKFDCPLASADFNTLKSNQDDPKWRQTGCKNNDAPTHWVG